MKFSKIACLLNILLIALAPSFLSGQTTVQGVIKDASNGEPLISASVQVKGTADGTITDFDGVFEFSTDQPLPFTIVASYTGYEETEIEITESVRGLKIEMEDAAVTIAAVEVKGQRVSDKQKAAPLTVESLDALAIKQTASDNFYDGLGALKGVDLTAASLGFKVINTRGFNSTSPVRSLQIIDGVDNQSPGLNFSLGNFLGAPELDVNRVDLIQGASSAFYGPNAFNGVISIETKNPFYTKGFSATIKTGERNLVDGAVRWADAIKNKDGQDWLAYKFNVFFLRADDWPAENFEAVDGTDSQVGNPGGWDAVNNYGDEFFSANDRSDPINLQLNSAGLGLFHRTGYEEVDLVDYDTRNTKANAAIHIRTNPAKDYESPEIILAGNIGSGTTVYQGDNRFSLRNILFYQGRLEFRKKDKFFLRGYFTQEDAGDSYDPYFTALRLQELAKSDEDWAQDYSRYWQQNIYGRMVENGYPVPEVVGGMLIFDREEAERWLVDNNDLLTQWHDETEDFANQASPLIATTNDFFVPGTPRFQAAFDSITSLKNNEGGTLFFDESALYHVHGEYTFTFPGLDKWVVGANGRWYRPVSDGTVFSDTSGTTITNSEFGVYTGIEKKFDRTWTINATVRMDKNQNFDYLFTPAASVVWSPNRLNYLRVSFSSAIRNPTLSDQYLNLDVGRATLLGNLNGFTNLLTVESLTDYLRGNFNSDLLEFFDAPPIQPEKVRTFEFGYRTTLFDKLYVDAGYYYSIYDDFIGFNIGIDSEFDQFGFPTQLDVYRVAANSTNQVTTQGFNIGANYYFGTYFQLAGNYSWNRLNKTFPDDPIIPAFNTPEHKYNLSISARNMPLDLGFVRFAKMGFNVNYKWIEGFIFEGSPQFTGVIPSYDLVDAQINFIFDKINTTLKIGASNVLDNRAFQTYGGPRIGRLAYVSMSYSWDKK